MSNQNNSNLAEEGYQVNRQYESYSSERDSDGMQESKYLAEANLIVNNYKKEYNDELVKLNGLLSSYKTSLINLENTTDLYQQYKQNGEQLFDLLKGNTNDVLTNERKTYYEDQEIDSLNFYYYLLLIIYVIVIICLAGLPLIYPTQYDWKVRLLIIIMFSVLPFISTWLLGIIIKIIYWLYSLLPKNVYK